MCITAESVTDSKITNKHCLKFLPPLVVESFTASDFWVSMSEGVQARGQDNPKENQKRPTAPPSSVPD